MTPKKNCQIRLILFFALAVGIILIATAFAEETPPPYKIINSELGPSKIAVAQPAKWNGKALLLAHDMRPEKEPLSADFAITDLYLGALLKEGWLIAFTSYHQNGYLLEGAVDDLDQLRAYVIKTYGKPKHLVVAGEGTGGAIVTRLAETRKGQYDGALAVSPVLLTFSNKYDYTPQMPLLLLCTKEESYEPKNYVAKAAELNAPLPPPLWTINRPGYGKISDPERLAALQGLLAYIDTGKNPGEKDITAELPQVTSSVAFQDGGAWATITQVSDNEYGNLDTNLTADDVAQIGLKLKDQVTVICLDKTVTALYGTNYGDVPQGDWIVLMMNGHLQVARCGENAAAFFGCSRGNIIFLAPGLKKTNAKDK